MAHWPPECGERAIYWVECKHTLSATPSLPTAAVVGAGPSGAVCGYYLAKGGGKVAVLDKETFPRDK